MIATIVRIALLRVWNNKQELLLMFAVPILFFSIFALIFSRGVGRDTPAIKVAVVDDDCTQLTKATVRLLLEQPALALEEDIYETDEHWPADQLARHIIRRRRVDIVVHFPSGIESRVKDSLSGTIALLNEGSNPVGRHVMQALLSQTVAAALSATTPRPTTNGSPVTNASARRPLASPSAAQPAVVPSAPPPAPAAELISFESTDVFAMQKGDPTIAMYAAGIAVMFLLFSASGAGGSLLEEQEAGTLDRLLCTRLTVTKLLAGKWLYITGLGCVQLTIMFIWAQWMFGVDLIGHLEGFAVMSLCTAAATASLALCLAVFCRSRSQLNAVSVVLILSMSALGGSMVPRYIMSDEMQQLGKLTFNAWALDGFQKVFWYDLPVSAIKQEVTVLCMMTLYFAFVARVFASRWSAA